MTQTRLTILTFVEGDLERGPRVGRREGVQVDGERRPVALPPIVGVAEPHPRYLLRLSVLHHLHLPRLLQERRVVVHIRYVHLGVGREYLY